MRTNPPSTNPTVDALPERPSLEALGRLITRYPDSAFLDLVAQRAHATNANALLAQSALGFPEGVNREFLAYFAWFNAILDPSHAGLEATVRMFEQAFHKDPMPRAPQAAFDTWLRSLYLTRKLESRPSILSEDRVHPETWWAVHTDILNPFLGKRRAMEEGQIEAWLSAMNEPFTQAGLNPISLDNNSFSLFDRLTPTPVTPVTSAPLITVIMSVYNPTQNFVTSVQSILQQSWRNLELIIVDDASTAGLDYLEAASVGDERVRVLRQPQNQGTYSARNHALLHAQGELVTFQDADDFAHPQRLEYQFAAMGGKLASLSRAIRLNQDLQITATGYRLISWSLPSLMFHRERVLARLGGFDPVRRAADAEFVDRLRASAGESAVEYVNVPLAIMQMTSDSLSRGDMGVLRRHPARMWYKAASHGWHAASSDKRIFPPNRPPVPAPAHITGESSRPLNVDIALLTQVAFGYTNDSAAIAEALAVTGATIGVLEFVSTEALRTDPSKFTPFDRLLIGQDPRVRLALPDQEVNAQLALIDDPAAALTMPHASLERLLARNIVVVMRRPYSQDALRAIAGRLTLLANGRVSWLPTTSRLVNSLRVAVPSATILPISPWTLPTLSLRQQTSGGPPRTGLLSTRFTGDHWWETETEENAPLTSSRLWSFGPSGRRDGLITRIKSDPTRWAKFLRSLTTLIVPHTTWISPPALDAMLNGVTLLAPHRARPVFGQLASYVPSRHSAAPTHSAVGAANIPEYLGINASPEAIRRTYYNVLSRLDEHA